MQTTLSLPDSIANKIRSIVEPVGGTIPGFAAKWAAEVAELSEADRAEIHQLIRHKLTRRTADERAPVGHIGAVPAIPNR